MHLPPGQHAIQRFPRFGAHLSDPPPAVPDAPGIAISGAVSAPVTVSVASLASLPRREVHADFHCVSGWTATGLDWEGVPFATFFAEVLEPILAPGSPVTHLVFGSLDGYRSVTRLEDLLGDNVLLAERLNGDPLDGKHGAPLRLLSPDQYGFMSVKHLNAIELHTSEPSITYHPAWYRNLGLQLVKPHERARVWEEERHRFLPAWLVRPVYVNAVARNVRGRAQRAARSRDRV